MAFQTLTRAFSLTLITFSASWALADSGEFKISGMTCKACVKAVQSKVCKLDTLAKCDVQIGGLFVQAKPGTTLDEAKIKELVKSAGSYEVTTSNVKKDVK